MSESEIDLTRRQSGKIHHLRSGRLHKLRVKTKYRCHMLEVEDVNFHFDSAVLLPDYGPFKSQEGPTPEQDRITGLAVLYACYRHAHEHPDQAALVIGHTDRSGSTGYNQQLSELRAENVFCALTGDREGWVKNVQQKSKVEDYQQILLWLTHGQGWQCDPGSKSNVHDPPTRQAVKAFQQQYNERFSASIDEDGAVGKQTWGAFFDVYMEELEYALGTDAAGRQEVQQALRFVQCEAIGCGEEFPITPDREENYKSAIDRRVEILFFDDGEEPVLDCKKPRGTCVELYEKKMYCVTPIPVAPLPLPSGIAVHVMLQCRFKDPEGKERPFPEGCPVTLEFPTAPSEQKKLGPDGLLDFFVPREKKAFTLRFQFGGVTYLASPPPDVLAPDHLVAEADVASLHQAGHRLFKLPRDFRLADADWQVSGASTYNTATHHFEQLDNGSITNIGSAATPAKVLLDPHWLYTRLEFFDRVYGHDHHGHERIPLPPLLLEGFRNAATAGDTPDEHCNWIANPGDLAKGAQCVPWILQNAGAKPDNKVLIQFRTQKNTFIVSDSPTTRRLEVITETEKLKPGPGRLKLYDLPELWKSQRYHARPASGDGAAFEKLTDAQIKAAMQPDKPLVFSLDDIILTDKSLTPLGWVPTDRAAIFSHKFGEDGHTTLATYGLYKPDTGNKQVFFSVVPKVEKTRNYIVDYPNWTRLVIAQGNAFDVFDKRTKDTSGGVVGARAGVRYLDVFASSSTFVPPGTQRPGVPNPTREEFITIQPLYEQLHNYHGAIGRFDLLFLRCCDVTPDETTEVGQALSYFRFFFNFNSTIEAREHAVPLGLSGATARDWVDKAIGHLLLRWNGPDGSENVGPAELRSDPGAALKLHVRTLWFAQDLRKPIAHYELGIFKDDRGGNNKVRAFMAASRGEGVLDQSNNKVTTTTFSHGITLKRVSTFAHETGHGGSLGDEYVEQTSPSSLPVPWLESFDSYSPGAPFSIDYTAMMRSNQQIRARFFWHLADWLWDQLGRSVEFDVRHGPHTYRVPHHPEATRKSHVNFPIRQKKDVERGAHGKYDVFFYPLGEEAFSASVLPKRAGKPGTFDGLFMVVVKMEFDFDTDNNTTIHNWLSAVNTQIDKRFNNRFFAKGTLDGRTYKRCLFHVSPRYLVDDYSATDPSDDDEHIEINVPDTGVPAWDSGVFADEHELDFPLNQPPNVFARFFAHMLGMADNTETNPLSYQPIVQAVMPGATVEAI